jgi:hypothetical protein
MTYEYISAYLYVYEYVYIHSYMQTESGCIKRSPIEEEIQEGRTITGRGERTGII